MDFNVLLVNEMKSILKSKKFRISMVVLVLVIAVVSGLLIYKSRSTKLIDKEAYADFKASLDERAGSEEGFSDQEALADFIVQWAKSNSIKCKKDDYGNIIFNKKAVSRKKHVTPTLIAVSMDHETAAEDSSILAAAAAIAYSDIDSGRRTVIFFNNDRDLAEGYKGIDKKYIGTKTKVIYLDKGLATYLSKHSFRQEVNKVLIPAEKTESHYDTAVKIHISGIDSGSIGPGITKQPDPFAALSSLLTRLKSKSVDYGITDLSIGSNGYMYPVSMDVTIALNSYNTSSFTSYIDQRIKNWKKTYGDDQPDLVFEYEVIDEEDDLPERVYDQKTCDKLTGILYTIQSGSYKYSENDALPEGKEAGDIYGFNCLTAIDTDNKEISIEIITQGYDENFTGRILNDNKAAVELYECKIRAAGHTDAFANERDSLSRTFTSTYNKVNKNATTDSELKTYSDNCFTPCSYLAEMNGKSDIIHIRVKGSTSQRIANTILCYIKTKGNTSIFN